ncbi:MAG TPA: hypothetical protein VGN13_00970 [Solirubrobacteraceae bacterium]|jgi:hypothetical protein
MDAVSRLDHALAGPACAAATTSTLAAVDGMVAERIYTSELVGPETIADRRQVAENAPLLSALAEGNRARITAAVHALVYSHTHIVRLRVSQGKSVLADIGGPYIVAPVGGNLFDHGRLVGRYLLSVQDDLGVVGLVKRLIGVPLTLRMGGVHVPLEGTVNSGAVAIPDRGAVTVHGHRLQAYSFDAKAFPTGVVRISLLLPRAGASAHSCAAVRVAELARIGRLIWGRFLLDRSPIDGFVSFLHSHTGALAYVRAGSRQLAGSTTPGPSRLPASGALRYRGVRYGVSSFTAETAAGRTRVYQLVRL